MKILLEPFVFFQGEDDGDLLALPIDHIPFCVAYENTSRLLVSSSLLTCFRRSRVDSQRMRAKRRSFRLSGQGEGRLGHRRPD